jgi:flagella basal body P-ring formation protein FlgA
MSNNSVKTSTPMHRLVQILCLTFFCLFLSGLPAHAQVNTPAQDMALQVRQWLAKAHGVESSSVDIAPLDTRLKVQTCAQSLTVDHPFASRDTVRVRCAQPVWQLYLQVSFAAPTTSQAKAGPVKTMVVPKRLLPRGTLLEPEMLEEVAMNTQGADTSLLSTIKDVEHAELVRDMTAGSPIRSSDLRRATMVKQGQQVMMVIGEKSAFQVIIRAEAMQDGRMGEQVKLKNTESGRQISGVVIGPNQVRGL